MFNPTISALLRGKWLLEEEYATNSLSFALGILQGKVTASEFLNGSGDFEGPFFLVPGVGKVDAYIINQDTGRMIFNSAAALPGSIAVVPFIGPVTKYNGSCGEPGMIRRQQWIIEMTALPGVIGYISLLDTPGGEADGTPQTAAIIKKLVIKTAAVIIGSAYSAGAWIFSAHDKAYAADKFCGVGSIGAYSTIFDYRGYFEKQGYKLITVYPDVSKDKNLSYRKAIDGDTTAIKAETSVLATSFVDEFAENRGDKLKSDDWRTGKVYSAEEAVQIGLIDGIKSLEDVVSEMRNPSDQKIKIKNNQNLNMKTSNVEALAGVANPSDEQMDLANADLTAAGITKVTLVPESMITTAAEVTTERDSLKTANQALTTQLTAATTAKSTAETALSAANVKITELEGKVEAFGKNAGANHIKSGGSDTPPDADDDEVEAALAAMPHNREAAAQGY